MLGVIGEGSWSSSCVGPDRVEAAALEDGVGGNLAEGGIFLSLEGECDALVI